MERYRPDIRAWRAIVRLCLSEASLGQGVGVRSSGVIFHCVKLTLVNRQSHSVRFSLSRKSGQLRINYLRDIISKLSSLARSLFWRQFVPSWLSSGHSRRREHREVHGISGGQFCSPLGTPCWRRQSGEALGIWRDGRGRRSSQDGGWLDHVHHSLGRNR